MSPEPEAAWGWKDLCDGAGDAVAACKVKEGVGYGPFACPAVITEAPKGDGPGGISLNGVRPAPGHK